MTTMESTIEGGGEVDRLGRVLSLAGREARRLARHPVLWLPLAIAMAAGRYGGDYQLRRRDLVPCHLYHGRDARSDSRDLRGGPGHEQPTAGPRR